LLGDVPTAAAGLDVSARSLRGIGRSEGTPKSAIATLRAAIRGSGTPISFRLREAGRASPFYGPKNLAISIAKEDAGSRDQQLIAQEVNLTQRRRIRAHRARRLTMSARAGSVLQKPRRFGIDDQPVRRGRVSARWPGQRSNREKRIFGGVVGSASIEFGHDREVQSGSIVTPPGKTFRPGTATSLGAHGPKKSLLEA